MRRPRRNLPLSIVMIVVTIALGLASRRSGARLPRFVADYSGDILWAFLAFLLFGLIFSGTSTRALALMALSFSILIEVSQLYHAPWIDSLRSTRIGGLVLGYGFLWSDIACYAMGIGLGVLFDRTRAAAHWDRSPKGNGNST